MHFFLYISSSRMSYRTRSGEVNIVFNPIMVLNCRRDWLYEGMNTHLDDNVSYKSHGWGNTLFPVLTSIKQPITYLYLTNNSPGLNLMSTKLWSRTCVASKYLKPTFILKQLSSTEFTAYRYNVCIIFHRNCESVITNFNDRFGPIRNDDFHHRMKFILSFRKKTINY